MKQKIRILSFVLAICLFLPCLTGITCVSAKGGEIIHVQDNGITYLEDENGYYHYYYDVYGNPISVEDSRMMLSEMTPIIFPQNEIQGAVYNYAEYYTQNQISGTKTKVTPDVAGPASITYLTSVTTTSSWSYSFQASFKNVIINKININASISYTNSSSSTTTFSSGFPVPANKIGAVYFTPYIMNTYVRTWDANGTYRLVNVKYPKKVGSFTDGLYELVVR